jgi:primosomal protein N' (replication factor Y)
MSSERTFQLLTQAAGRAGRDKKPGCVVIQTYQPEHYCITSAASQDYERFYNQEIMFRRMMHYPPETQMLMLLAEGADDEETSAAMNKMRAMIRTADFQTVEVIGPSKASISKGKDMYRYVLYMKHQQENELIRLKDFLEGYLKWSGQFQNIYFNFDFNPVVPG